MRSSPTVVCAMAVGMTIGLLAIGIGVTAFSQDVPDRPWSTGGPAPNLEPFELPPTSVLDEQKGSNYLGMVASIPPEDQFTRWRSEYEADIMVSLASLAGELGRTAGGWELVA